MFEIEQLKYRGILDIPSLVLDAPITCIVGASGSGKTTLLRMLNKLNVPDEGRIRYEGRDLAEWDAVELRRQVVMLGQTPVLYPGTVGDNLQIGLEFSQKIPASKDRMKQCLERVGLEKGLDETCGSLSGGEKQRLCLARVMLLDAETYLLDEPSAALDRETERFIIQNFVEFAREREKQLIMVTHSEAVASAYAEGLVRITNGWVERGNGQ